MLQNFILTALSIYLVDCEPPTDDDCAMFANGNSDQFPYPCKIN